MKKLLIASFLLISSFQLFAQEAYLGEIKMFAGTYAPSGWALCDGQIMSISENATLYSILGTLYGGDGRSTFALPDLRGRVPMHVGSGPGLSSRRLGYKIGTETNTLSEAQLPAHTHVITVTQSVRSDEGESDDPAGRYPASAGKNSFSSQSGSVAATLNASAGNTGGNQAVNNMQPGLGVNFIICLDGLYPSRY